MTRRRRNVGIADQRRRAVRIELVTADITAEQVDAVVNAANSSLLGGGGVDGAIHRKGGPAILKECRALRASRYGRGLPIGQAVATTAGRLPARWVIHTVGPVFSTDVDRAPLLRSCYTTSLAVAAELGARSIGFPLISSGVYRWPKEDAVLQALTALHAEPTGLEVIRLVLFDEQTRRTAEHVYQTLNHTP
jgi:O-acetyl-ADP-ribose deacetylase (regulator of RNase III)